MLQCLSNYEWRERSSRCEQYKKSCLRQISVKKEELPSQSGFLVAAVGNWGFF